jgi:hypothetical protein
MGFDEFLREIAPSLGLSNGEQYLQGKTRDT